MRYCRTLILVLTCVAGPLTVAGCTRDVNPVRDVFVSVGAGAKVPPAPDFVVESRTSNQGDYIPVGIRQPPRKYRARTPDEIKEVEGQLDAVRARTEAQGIAVQREGTGQTGE